MDVYVGVSDARRKLLWQRSMEPPPAVHATFLVDTGADTTLVDEQITRTLGLTAINQRRVVTSESGGIPKLCNLYDIGLEIRNGGSAPWRIPAIHALGRPLMDEAMHGVIGRDILDTVNFHYDGPRQLFTIDYAY